MNCTQKSAQILGRFLWQRRLDFDNHPIKSPRLLRYGLGRRQGWLYLHHWLSVISWQHAHLLELSKNNILLLALPLKQNIKPWLTRRVSCYGSFPYSLNLATLPTANPVIYCDNLGATHLSANHVFHSRMKHIALAYHSVRENVQNGKFRVSFVSTDDQLADILTKPLLRPRFDYLLSKLHLSFRPYNLQEDINNNN